MKQSCRNALSTVPESRNTSPNQRWIVSVKFSWIIFEHTWFPWFNLKAAILLLVAPTLFSARLVIYSTRLFSDTRLVEKLMGKGSCFEFPGQGPNYQLRCGWPVIQYINRHYLRSSRLMQILQLIFTYKTELGASRYVSNTSLSTFSSRPRGKSNLFLPLWDKTSPHSDKYCSSVQQTRENAVHM